MKRLGLFLALVGAVSAHEEEGVQSCAGPVLSELTLPFTDLVILLALALAGLVIASWAWKKKKHSGYVLAGLLLFASSAGYYAFFTPGFNSQTGFFVKNVHEHADMKVFLNQNAVNFSQDRFQSTQELPLTEYIHFHDGTGNDVHKHATGVPLSYLFKTFGGILNASCVGIDGMLCTNSTHDLKFYVNGKKRNDPGTYELHDLDRILISLGPTVENVSLQLDAVTSEACIPSGKCPVPEGYDLHRETCTS